jgi:hypothetical protein
MFLDAGEELPDPAKLRITCGWPSRGGTAKRKPVIGQCWDVEASGDLSNEIFISPMLEDAHDVAATVVHELIHVKYGSKVGHKGAFKRAALKLGLEGKMTATIAGEELTVKLKAIVLELGTYPHSRLTPTLKTKKQGTRMLKASCPKCGYTIRLTKQWALLGMPRCSTACAACEFELEFPLEDEGEGEGD